MKTNKFSLNKILIMLALAIILVCSCVGLFFNANSANAVTCDVESAEELKTTYLLNEELQIPTANLIHEGEEYPATSKNIVFPDGKIYKKATVTLSMVGEYIVNYYHESDDLYLSGTKKFTVVGDLYSVTGAMSTVSYNGVGIKNTDATGLEVALSAGGVFTYNKSIDLTGRKSTDVILKMFMTPDAIGTAEASDFIVKLTDAYDENNYVLVKTTDALLYADKARSIQSYQSANAYNQPLTGLRQVGEADSNTISYDGSNYYLDVNTKLGYMGFFSFCANGGYANASNGIFTLSMDYEKRQVFGCRNYKSGANGMIIDLDEPLFFDKLWEGFTTGEAFLSIYSDTILSNTFQFAITEICEEDLTKTTVEDVKAPVISIDYVGENERDLPFAKLNSQYKVYDAVIVDDFKVKEEQIAVYYDYRGNNPVQISIKDGCFTPTMEGVYSIVYYASDSSGHQTYKVVDVKATASEKLSFNCSVITATPKAGSAVIASGTASNASGNVMISGFATLKSNTEISYPLDLTTNGLEFVPLYSGEYEIKVLVSDYVDNIEKVLTAQVSSSDTFVFGDEPSLPYVFVKGATYDVAGYTALSLADGAPKSVNATIKYAFDSETTQTLSNGQFTVTANDYVLIEYVFSPTCIKPYKIPVVDVLSKTDKGANRYDVKNYFYGGDNFTPTATSDYTTYTTDVGGELYFINNVLATGFLFDFRVSQMNFGSMTLVMTDVENTYEKLVAKFIPIDDNTTKIIFNDTVTYYLAGGLENNLVNFSYSKKIDACSINGKTVKVEGFNGFSSGLARLMLDFDNVTKQSSIQIHRINFQKISDRNTDIIEPLVNYDFIGYTATLNDEFYIENIVVSDVLCFTPTIKISMYGGDDKEHCTTDDGILMKNLTDYSRDYRFKFTEYGVYTLKIEISDDAENVKTYYVKITVEDSESPVITLGDRIYTATVGKQINLNNYFTVSDNVDSDVSVNIFVIGPSGIVSAVTDGLFTPEVAGKHSLIIYATDDNGNTGSESYIFTVK